MSAHLSSDPVLRMRLMTRGPLVLALALLGACAAQQQQAAYELSATRAALSAQAEAPAELDAVVYLANAQGAPSTQPLEAAPIELESAAPPAAAPGPAGGALDATSSLTPSGQPAPQTYVAASSPWEEGAVYRGSSASMDNLARALDESRQTQIMEARLADKQRHIDRLEADVAALQGRGPVGASAPAQPARDDGALLAAIEAQRAEDAARWAEVVERLDALEEAPVAPEEGPSVSTSEPPADAALQPADGEQEARLEELRAVEAQRLADAQAAHAAALAENQRAMEELAARYMALEDENEALREQELRDDRWQRRMELWQERRMERIRGRQTLRTVKVQAEHASAAPATDEAALRRAAEEAVAEQARLQGRDEATQSEALSARVQSLELALEANDAERVAAALDEIEGERELLEAERAEIEAQRGYLESEGERLTQLRRAVDLEQEALAERMEVLQEQRAAGEQSASLEAELAEVQRQLDEARMQELQAGLLEDEVLSLRARVVEIDAMQEELDALRTRSGEADAMQQQLQDIEARKEAASERWTEALAPLTEAGVEVSVEGDRARIKLPSDVLFASGSARLSPEGREAIAQVSLALADMPQARVRVEGHTDDRPMRGGSYATNWDLAFARARGVLDELVRGGIAEDRVSALSYGDTRPVTSNATAEGRAANRRIEISLTLDDGVQ